MSEYTDFVKKCFAKSKANNEKSTNLIEIGKLWRIHKQHKKDCNKGCKKD